MSKAGIACTTTASCNEFAVPFLSFPCLTCRINNRIALLLVELWHRNKYAHRALVKAKFPLHAHIPVLLELIGDHEENIIETVMLIVVHAR